MKYLTKTFFIVLLFSSYAYPQFSWDNPKTNLKVFPDSIKGHELRKQMVGFSQSLGVRCWYCHDDTKGKDLNDIDFASDKKPQKQIAREMIRMSGTINGEHMPKVKLINSDASNVACMTCHRGYPKPQHLYQVLMESYDAGGVSAAINKYDELKEKYYGGFTFDFRENSLNFFGYQILNRNNLQDALQVFKLNAELYPNSYNVYDSLGDVYYKMEQYKLALDNYNKSLSINSSNKNAREMVGKISSIIK